MEIELLVVPGCSSRTELEGLIQDLLTELNSDAALQVTVVETTDQARELRFPGSPTVRINGRDLEPEAPLGFGLG